MTICFPHKMAPPLSFGVMRLCGVLVEFFDLNQSFLLLAFRITFAGTRPCRLAQSRFAAQKQYEQHDVHLSDASNPRAYPCLTISTEICSAGIVPCNTFRPRCHLFVAHRALLSVLPELDYCLYGFQITSLSGLIRCAARRI